MQLKAIINSIMSGGKMNFPKEVYQIMVEDGRSCSESLKQINAGMKGIQDSTKESMVTIKLLQMCFN